MTVIRRMVDGELHVCHIRLWFTLPTQANRSGCQKLTPNLQNEYKHCRWNPSVLDSSSPSADSRKKVNHNRIMKWKEIINIIISLSYYARCDWSILPAAFHCYASFLSFPVPMINLRDIINISLTSFSLSLL